MRTARNWNEWQTSPQVSTRILNNTKQQKTEQHNITHHVPDVGTIFSSEFSPVWQSPGVFVSNLYWVAWPRAKFSYSPGTLDQIMLGRGWGSHCFSGNCVWLLYVVLCNILSGKVRPLYNLTNDWSDVRAQPVLNINFLVMTGKQ